MRPPRPVGHSCGMRLLLNLIWLIFGGFFLAVGYAIAGLICFVLIITIPFGIACFRMANFCLWPFGRKLVDTPGAGAPSVLGNIIWLVFGGLISGLAYVLVGVLLCLTVVGAPFGVQAFKIGVATLAPFGKRVVELPQANSTLRIVFNVLWLVTVGWEIAISHLVWAGVLALTIVGVPFAIQHIKLIPLALFPFGRDLR